jgi:hypothetical protein
VPLSDIQVAWDGAPWSIPFLWVDVVVVQVLVAPPRDSALSGGQVRRKRGRKRANGRAWDTYIPTGTEKRDAPRI